MENDDKGTGEISRREVLKKGMKTGAYVAPVILSASAAGGVSAQGMVSRPPAPTPPTGPRTAPPILLRKQFDSVSANGRTINFLITLDNVPFDPATGQPIPVPPSGQAIPVPPLYDVLIADTITRSSSGTIGPLTFTGFLRSDNNVQDNGNGTFTVQALRQDVGFSVGTVIVLATATLNTSLNPGERVTNTVTGISASVGAPGASAPFAAPPPTATAVYTMSTGTTTS